MGWKFLTFSRGRKLRVSGITDAVVLVTGERDGTLSGATVRETSTPNGKRPGESRISWVLSGRGGVKLLGWGAKKRNKTVI